jgi:hypothetical protein
LRLRSAKTISKPRGSTGNMWQRDIEGRQIVPRSAPPGSFGVQSFGNIRQSDGLAHTLII